MQAAAPVLGLTVHEFQPSSPDELAKTFAATASDRMDAVAVSVDTMFATHAGTIAELAAAHRPLAVGPREFAEGGGVIGYGMNVLPGYRRSAYYIDKILKGAEPETLPVEQASTFEPILDLKTATAIGVTIPCALPLRADRIVE